MPPVKKEEEEEEEGPLDEEKRRSGRSGLKLRQERDVIAMEMLRNDSGEEEETENGEMLGDGGVHSERMFWRSGERGLMDEEGRDCGREWDQTLGGCGV